MTQTVDAVRSAALTYLPASSRGSPTAREPLHRGGTLQRDTHDLPGWEIQRVCGEVFGLTVRSRNAVSQFGAGFKSMFGGELQSMTKNLAESRNEAMARLMNEARNKGATRSSGCASTPPSLATRGPRSARTELRCRLCRSPTQSPRLFRTTCSAYRGLQYGFRHGLGCIPIRGSLITRAPLVTIVT
jgi:Putative heavy-metal-binding